MIEEERFPAGALTDQLFECGGSPGPKRTAARFTAFALQGDRGHVEVQIADPHLCGFAGPGAGVVEEQQQGIVALSLSLVPIGRAE